MAMTLIRKSKKKKQEEEEKKEDKEEEEHKEKEEEEEEDKEEEEEEEEEKEEEVVKTGLRARALIFVRVRVCVIMRACLSSFMNERVRFTTLNIILQSYCSLH
jgi:uncharacterized membrane protein YdbT with pleckstrin-like domain